MGNLAGMARGPKFVIVIPDGAADEPFEGLEGRTPLQVARIPEMDRLAAAGIVGRSRNVPDRFLPASDVATLSLFGYDPERYYTGRAPLEAARSEERPGGRSLVACVSIGSLASSGRRGSGAHPGAKTPGIA